MMRGVIGLLLPAVLCVGCAGATRYHLGPPQLGAATVTTGYAPYTAPRVSALHAEHDAERIVTTDPRIFHDCLQLTPAERVKWPACQGKLW
jgi:hypothetical protein